MLRRSSIGDGSSQELPICVSTREEIRQQSRLLVRMATTSEILEPQYWQYPAQVLGCLRDGEITVILCPGIDDAETIELPIHMIPSHLRMPNSEFDIQLDRVTGCFIKVLQKGATSPDAT